ncbi:YeeE/YedE family protein [Psychrosphaera sp. B3R10]|uniref:YeeE/YedE family protein n=1 Tax=Psychrosphaera algicola TaxID=3023714 RepID=A0ABT5FDB0_9GAMM|nr:MULTISPECIES: DUF6691 family protein [unclassified Psychrosphaera]MBU2882640.1 YeeE/YedE family protein [Psychrosphaera sp. I2R16]MBU2989341.1 YeeE/YedE family protein [Psychrosphaera sp. B3R10]MDC2889515.1 YeeE/YedE family protein [Psychrosphaera sp. G1-22]MDO6718175.1 YeeE/YedE family protein [Psychrosphaera sp. 1_MG-2023]
MNNKWLSKINLFAIIAGSLFGAGLAISGMTNTVKVQSFLDLFGEWDITLGFVMAGALIVSFVAFRFVLKNDKPIFHDKFEIPTSKDIDSKLLTGAAMFGAGWAIVGYCPGPAIASLIYGYWQTFVFVVAMLVGSWIARKFT